MIIILSLHRGCLENVACENSPFPVKWIIWRHTMEKKTNLLSTQDFSDKD